MTVSAARLRATKKYEAKTYDRQGFRFPKGYLDVIRKAAEAHGESLNAFVLGAVRDKIERIEKEAR